MALQQKKEKIYILKNLMFSMEDRTVDPRGLEVSYGDLRRNILPKKTSDLLLQLFLFFNFQSKPVCPGSGLTKKPGPDPDLQHRTITNKCGGTNYISYLEAKKSNFWPEEKNHVIFGITPPSHPGMAT
jgi:hypothetical protein